MTDHRIDPGDMVAGARVRLPDNTEERRVTRIGADELLPGKNFSLWKSHATCVAAAINQVCPQAHAKPVQIGNTWSWCVEVYLDAVRDEPEMQS